MKQRVKNTPSAKLRRQATAYMRLYYKADRAGEPRVASSYLDKALHLRAKADRAEQRETTV